MYNRVVLWWKSFQSKHTVWIMLFGALFYAAFSTNDSYIIRILLPNEHLISIAAYLSVGAIVGVILNTLLLLTPAGQIIDADYVPGSFLRQTMNRKAFILAGFTGFIGAIATGIVLYAYDANSPAVVQSIEIVSILLVITYENFRSPKKLIIMSGIFLLTLLGVLGVSLSPLLASSATLISVGQLFTLFVLVLVVVNILHAAGEIGEGKGSSESNGALFLFWRFVFLAIFGVIFAVIYALLSNQWQVYLDTIVYLFRERWPNVLLTMLFVFVGLGWSATAKRYVPVAVSNGWYATNIFFAAILPALFWKDVSDKLPQDDQGKLLMAAGMIAIVIAAFLAGAVQEGLTPRQMLRQFRRGKDEAPAGSSVVPVRSNLKE